MKEITLAILIVMGTGEWVGEAWWSPPHIPPNIADETMKKVKPIMKRKLPGYRYVWDGEKILKARKF